MKLSELLEGREPKYPSQPVGDLAIVPWVEKHATKFSSNPIAVYRGSHDKHDIVVIDTNAIQRQSRNTYNFYTLWMDNHPTWAAYPKRSKSLICSSSLSTARGYNNSIRVVIPDDDCKIGVCSQGDLWWSFSKVKSFFKRVGISAGGMDTNNDKLAVAFDELLNLSVAHPSGYNDDEDAVKDLDWPTMKSALEEITSDLIRDTVREKSEDWRANKLQVYITLAKRMERSGYDNLYELFADIMSPEKNGFKLISPADLNTLGDDNEIWIGGGKALSVEYTTPQLDDVFKTRNWINAGGSSTRQQYDGQEWEAFH